MTSSSIPPNRHVRSLAALATLVLSVPVLLPAPTADAAVLGPAQAWDFNGDGYGDLAVGAPDEWVNGQRRAGAVTVALGGRTGLVGSGTTWTLDSTGVVGTAANTPAFGSGLASADFDRDGYADLAVASPNPGAGRHPTDRGGVNVLYGSGHGLSARRDVRVAVPDPKVDVGFAQSIVAADFNGDGYGDLAVGAAECGAVGTECRVLVYLGGEKGIALRPSRMLDDQDTAHRRWFGRVLAAGDFDGDGRDDLAITSNGQYSVLSDARVHIVPGSVAGPDDHRRRTFRAAGTGLELPGVRYTGSLGWSLAAGDTDGDGFDELVIGDVDGSPPGSARGCLSAAACSGLVLVLKGSSGGITVRDREVWWPRRSGVPGAGIKVTFGQVLAMGDIDRDGRADLAIGVLGASESQTRYDTGAVVVLKSGRRGLTSVGAQRWSQDSAGVPGRAEESDYFGSGLRLLDLGRGGGADLIVGARAEDVDGAADAGTAVVLYSNGDKITGHGARSFDQNSPHVQGTSERGDGFGVL